MVNPNLQHLNDAYAAGKRGAVLEGSSRCFSGSQKVITDTGLVPISELKKNDIVLSHNHLSGSDEYRKVLSCIKQPNVKSCFRIKMKNGDVIECTEDHKFYFNGRYIEIKYLVDLWKNQYYGKLENNTGL
jgi:hypothetical protein